MINEKQFLQSLQEDIDVISLINLLLNKYNDPSTQNTNYQIISRNFAEILRHTSPNKISTVMFILSNHPQLNETIQSYMFDIIRLFKGSDCVPLIAYLFFTKNLLTYLLKIKNL